MGALAQGLPGVNYVGIKVRRGVNVVGIRAITYGA